MRLTKEDQHKMLIAAPSPDFSERHNRWVIEQSIKKTNENYRKIHKSHQEGIAERTDMLSSYVMHVMNKSAKPIEKYIGKSYLRQLIGEERLERIKRASLARGYQL